MLLGVGTFFDSFDTLAIAVALTVIFTTLHISFTNAGFLIGAGFAGQFVGAWICGYLSETYGRRVTFIFSLALFGLLSIVCAFSWNFQSLLTIRVVQGLGLGGEVPVAGTLFNEYLRASNRGRIGLIYQSLYIWGAIVAGFVGVGLFSIFGPELGWRALFLFGGIPALVAFYSWFALPELTRWLAEQGRFDEADRIVSAIEAETSNRSLPPLQVVRQPPPTRTRLSELFSGIYRRRTILLWTQWTVTFFVVYGYVIWLPTLYVRIGGLAVNNAIILTIVTYVVTVSVIYAEAWLVEVVGRKPLFITGFVLIIFGGVLGALAILIFHATGWPILFASTLVLGCGTGLNSSAAFNYSAELYPTRIRGLGVATGSSMNRFASIVSPFAVGAMLDAKLGIAGVLLMFAVAGLIGLVVMATMGIETKGRTLEELSP